jgi:hypothetical protein
MRLSLRLRVLSRLACIFACVLAWVAAPGVARPAPQSFAPTQVTAPATEYITIPGPLRSFLRMAGISQKAAPEEVLPLFGHFVETYGYEGSKEKSPRATEALIIFRRYFVEANTLASLAGPDQIIQFSSCDAARPLIADLGYKLVSGCDKIPSIEVDDQERAFVTVDSGFPLADLQQALRDGKPFILPYPSSRVPLIYTKRDWTAKANAADIDVVTTLADQPVLARLYWSLSRVDEQTRAALLQSDGVPKLAPYASVIDFYGSSIAVRDGRVTVPGGSSAEAAWSKLAGADPANPGDFVTHLLSKDGGWLAEYYDSLARAPQPQLAYFTSGDHLARFYTALHGTDTSSAPVRSIFRPGASLLLLVTRLPLDANGQPLVPGNLAAWRDAFHGKARAAANRDTADGFVEELFTLARGNSLGGPLDVYSTLSEVDRNRAAGERLKPETVRLLIAHYGELRDQMQMFSEFSALSDASIAQFVRATGKIDQIRDPLLRADTMGIFEANLGLWQIFARQGQIPGAQINESWQLTIEPFAGPATSTAPSRIVGAPALFDAARASLSVLMKTASGSPDITQEKLVGLLAGPSQPTTDARQVHEKMADEIRAVLTDQRLVSLDTLLELGDDFAKLAHTPNGVDAQRAAMLAQELEEARSPRAMFTESERAEWAPGHEPNKHVMNELHTDLAKSVSGTQPAAQASAMRGSLTPFLRDTLVGLNYAYYEPPGGQILHNSPLLVREHDFLASEAVDNPRAWQAPQLFGIGLTAGNGTHLSGSLAGLPYALAQIEQDFIVPENVQALIWHDTAADLLTSGVVPRWWSTSQDALHAAALYQEAGEELVTGAAKDAALRADVVSMLSPRFPPETTDRVDAELNGGHADDAIATIAPADMFYLTVAFRKAYPNRTAVWGPAGTELNGLIEREPSVVSPEVIARDFGVPHPMLAQSYRDEMLNLRPFPSLMDYASELLAESWESSNLYWARLADEAGYTPVMLNELAPVLTRRMVEKIFGSDFDDWAALMRAMRETGDDFRRGQVAGVPKITTALPR